MEWFRVWHDYFDDAKLRACTKARKFDVLTLIRLASGNNPRGIISLEDADSADYLGLNMDEFSELVAFLERKKITDRDSNGHIRFLHWERRQPKSDNVAERVAKSRANKAIEESVTLHHYNGNVTVTDRTEQNREEQSRGTARAHAPEPPSIDKVRSFAKLHGASDQAERYFNHRQRTGWMFKGQPIIDWVADFKYWCSNGFTSQYGTDLRQSAAGSSTQAPPPIDLNREDPEITRIKAREALFDGQPSVQEQGR